MKFNRSMGSLLAMVSLTMLPLIANAHPLSIVNNTNSPLSFTVNNQCSEEIGTLNQIEVKTITEEALNKLCLNYTQPCTINAYYGSHCPGETIGGMTYESEHSFGVRGGSERENISVTAREDTLIYTSALSQK